MATETSIPVTTYARRKYKVTSPINVDVAKNYLQAIVAIAGADGELAQEEIDWFIEEQYLVGVPEEVIEENIRKFDWRNADIEKLLGGIHYDFPLNFYRCMLYQAIRMSRADGIYHEKEKAAVAKAAQILGVEKNIVASIESLVEIEESTDRLRYAIFETGA